MKRSTLNNFMIIYFAIQILVGAACSYMVVFEIIELQDYTARLVAFILACFAVLSGYLGIESNTKSPDDQDIHITFDQLNDLYERPE